MPLQNKELKAKAWKAMRAAVPPAILVTLVYYLLTQALAGVINLVVPPVSVDSLLYGRGMGITITLFLMVLLTLYQLVMNFGYQVWVLYTARREPAGYGTLLNGFGMVGRVLLMELFILVRMLGWVLLVSMLIGLLMTPFFLLLGEMALPFFVLGMPVVLLAVLWVMFCRYDLAPYCLWDHPEEGAAAAVRRSVSLVRPRLWGYIKLHLSFWPWYVGQFLLGLLGIGILAIPSLASIQALLAYGDISAALDLIQELTATRPGILVRTLTELVPLGMFFIPYLNLSIANFYRAASGDAALYREQDPWPDWSM